MTSKHISLIIAVAFLTGCYKQVAVGTFAAASAAAVFAYDSLGEDRKLAICIDNADLVPGNWDWDNDKPHRGYWQTVDACRAKFPNGKY